MIQRIQSVYLFLTTLLSLLFLRGSFLSFEDKSGSVIKITLTGIYRITGEQNSEVIKTVLPLTFIIILIPVICLVTIFLFKKRKTQKLLAIILIILVAGFIIVLVSYSWFVISEYKTGIVPGIRMAIPALMLISSVLTYRGIKKDDNLIKSYDRLR
jgi:cytochrome bd-type quinol oxidase subunit 2